MPGYLSNLIRNGARPVAPPRRPSLLAAALPLRTMTLDWPVAKPRSIPTNVPAPNRVDSPAKASNQAASVPFAKEGTPPQQTDPAPPPVRSTLPADGIEKPAPAILARADGELSLRRAPIEISDSRAIEPALPPARSAVPETESEDIVPTIVAPVSVEKPQRPTPVEISSSPIIERQTPSVPSIKPAPMPVPRIEFSSSKAPIRDAPSSQPASAGTITQSSEPLRWSALDRALPAPIVTRDFSAASQNVPARRAQSPSLDSPKPEEPLPANRPGQPLPSRPSSARSLSPVRLAEISVREDVRHRQLPTRVPEEPRLIIQRLDVQIINESAPVHRRAVASRSPVAPRADADPLCLDRRHVRRLL